MQQAQWETEKVQSSETSPASSDIKYSRTWTEAAEVEWTKISTVYISDRFTVITDTLPVDIKIIHKLFLHIQCIYDPSHKSEMHNTYHLQCALVDKYTFSVVFVTSIFSFFYLVDI
jgi:hypothetical protein